MGPWDPPVISFTVLPRSFQSNRAQEQSPEGSAEAPAQRQYPSRMEGHPPGHGIYGTLNQSPLFGAVSSISHRIQEPRTGCRGVVPFKIASNDLHRGILCFLAPQFWALQS